MEIDIWHALVCFHKETVDTVSQLSGWCTLFIHVVYMWCGVDGERVCGYVEILLLANGGKNYCRCKKMNDS